MSHTHQSIRDKLAPHADDLEAAAEDADDEAAADLATVLAALSKGEDPPADAARRVARRMEES